VYAERHKEGLLAETVKECWQRETLRRSVGRERLKEGVLAETVKECWQRETL
jgi:hypothetical protein